MTTAVDWTPFEKCPEGTTVTCQCGERFRSHAKGVYSDGSPRIVSKKPCPRCGASEGHRSAASDPELMTIGGE